ncbi:DUF3320 domain-containing protein [Persicimonas caeni]|uniref:DUF3320 domain-containing protein n=1 Tax=Persicimonas caeni TaxID=2292766 RepID=A0A4Y6PV42_PERCE|nr:DUF3320 domain-containing protein [Persicimonas caeni]QDG52113.1 DUF3320 domain-containing protein [Persicimonas caeni]QED33334.1 DUF3320 domain-containing protein [Persicimonas caeni]
MDTSQFNWNDVEVTVEYGGVVNYALQQNRMPVVSALSLEHKGGDALRDVRVELATRVDGSEPWTAQLAKLEPEHIWNKRQINLDFPSDELAGLDERKRTELVLRLAAKNVEPAEFELPIEWLAYNEWHGVSVLPQILSAFVLPNHPDVVQVVTRMRDIMERWTGNGSLPGYQTGDPDQVRKMAASAYGALQELGFSYVDPPASFETAGQKVRTPEQMLNSRMGTCLDVTLLTAAALEHIGLHPILVVIQGHAFVGVWLREETFAEPIVDDPTQLRKRAKLSHALFFDPTLAVSGGGLSFEKAEAKALAHVEDFPIFEVAVDVRAARLTGIRPMASRVFDEDGRVRLLDHSNREDRVEAAAPSLRPDAAELEGRAQQHLARVAQLDEDEFGRLQRWRSKLLDLSLNNRLLNFKHTLSTAMLLHQDLGRLEDALATGKTFKLHPKPQMIGALSPMSDDVQQLYDDQDKLRELLDNDLDAKRLHSAYPPAEHAKRLKKIYRDARREMQESGVNLLHVAVGFLRWFDPNSPQTPRLAPLILLPAKLERVSATDNYKLSLTDDEALINHSLLEKLRQEFSLEVEGLSVLPEDASGLDIDLIFKQFREAILDAKGWDILEFAFLGILSFGKFMMWHDLRANEERLFDNPVAKRVLNPTENVVASEEDSSTQSTGDKVTDFCVMEADSSQLEAVRAASKRESFVLQGPPGTGKSQTITNIIAQCLADGRNILFVAEKKAALEVVYKRLSNVGLDDFCLRLHSDSANKRAVASQLGNALRQAKKHTPTEWDALVKKLEASRRPINAYVETLHRRRNIGLSIFEAVARLTELEDVQQIEVELETSADELGAEQFSATKEAVQSFADFAREVAPVSEHPLAAIRAEVLDPDRQRSLKEQLEELAGAISDVRKKLEELPDAVPAPDDQTLSALEAHAEAMAALSKRPTGGRLLAATSGWEMLAPRLQESIETGRELQQSRATLEERYTDELFELDLRDARRKFGQWGDAFFLIAFFMLWSVRRQLRAATKDGNLADNNRVTEHLDVALEVGKLEQKLSEQSVPPELQGTLWQGASTDWAMLDEASQWREAYRQRLSSLAARESWSQLAQEEVLPWQGGGEFVDAYRAAVERLSKAYQAVVEATEFDEESILAAETWLENLDDMVSGWRSSMGELRPWSLYLRARAKVSDVGLPPIVDGLEQGDVEAEELPLISEKAVLSWWTERMISADKQLVSFSGLSHRRAIEKFRELDRKSFELAQKEIRARLSAQIPEPRATSTSSEIGILLREIQKKSRHIPIRELFDRIPNLLPRVAPCMLMSPMSVAQYLSDDPVDFDVVVFDEASQIPPWDALGAISRADQCIVVGDSKQLPPTSFFSKTYEDEEIQEVEDLESILDECVASGLQSRRLRWHYRSRDESLIAFSNFHYYDNDLFTFPSAMDELSSLGVSYRHIEEGYYDKGRTRTNEAEARAIVAEIVQRLKDPEDARRSIGVVTFSQAQQTLIEDLLDEARRDNPSIEPYFSDAVAEPVFVKNLENVQGDERDIMMFSICYAPDENGKLSMNFGPLNRKGGERRLNVAITRAREQLIVFAKLRAEQIDLTRTSARAVEHLKTFLKYAEIGPRAIAEATTRSSDSAAHSAIQRRIEEFLKDAGYDVRTNVGCSGYQVDVAVRHPDYPDTFLLGIELDGESYRLGSTARDRERTRLAVLKSLGWRIHRIWTADWWHNRDRELERLKARLEELRKEEPPALTTATNEVVVAEADEEEDDKGFEDVDDEQRAWVDELLDGGQINYLELERAVPYRAAELREDVRTQDQFNNDNNLPGIAHSVMKIVDKESPVLTASVLRRVVKHWGYSRLSGRIEKRILDSLASLPAGKRPRQKGEFLWSAAVTPSSYRIFRPSKDGETPREADEIAPEEAANAAYAILGYNMSLPPDDLYRETVRAFGFSQLGSNLREVAEEAVELLVKQGRATVDSGMVSVVKKEAAMAE